MTVTTRTRDPHGFVNPCHSLALVKISKSDEEKLALLEFKPGDNAVTTLGMEDWKEVKFTTLGWKRFLTAHKQFIHDVKNGLWIEI